MAGTFSIYKYCKTNSGWRYCKAAFHSNGKIKPNVVIVSGVEEKHTEGRYFLNFNGQWIDVGVDAPRAQRQRQLRLNQIEYERISGRSSVAAPAGRPSVIEFKGRRVIKDEVEAYLAEEVDVQPLAEPNEPLGTSYEVITLPFDDVERSSPRRSRRSRPGSYCC